MTVAETIRALVAEIKAFYEHHAPGMLALHYRVRPCTETQLAELEERLGVILPEDYKTFLGCCDFQMQLVGHFNTFGHEKLIDIWELMLTLQRAGAFRGRNAAYVAPNYGVAEGIIQPCWWHAAWIPFAEDSVGNLKCLDLAPAVNGVLGQVVEMEVQHAQGPFATQFPSFLAYLEAHLGYLRRGQYTVTDGLLEIDDSLEPQTEVA